jgi:alpha-galactosidase
MKKIILASLLMMTASVFAEEDMSKYILTPPVGKEPRITGAKIFGARPGNPFLFKVSATGEKPRKYVAANLPKGLDIDPDTGIISGTAPQAGDYRVNVTVSNPSGNATRELRIRIGDTICLTPPMGWNSWYCHSELISEKAIRETATAMVDKGLIDHGWTYVNLDDCWQGVRGGKYQAIQPNERFTDMKGMCDYLHSLGLKAGIYSTPWMGTYAGFIGGSATNQEGDCSADYLPEDKRLQKHQVFGRYPGTLKKKLNRVGSTWFFDKDAKQWAEWGFDYVKVDWLPNDIPTTKRMFEDLKACGRDLIFSLSNNAPFENAKGLSEYANCWRTTHDIHDKWESITKIGFSQEKWQPFGRPGHWNDPDMLQVGRRGVPNQKNTSFNPTHLTPDEQFTQVSLWCLLSAPLLLSCDIASLDAFTLSLLTNDEVLEVNQDPLGLGAKRITSGPLKEIWTKQLEDGSVAVGLFNLSNEKGTVEVAWKDLGLTGSCKVRDLWRQKDLGVFADSFSVPVNAHGVVLVKVKKNK